MKTKIIQWGSYASLLLGATYLVSWMAPTGLSQSGAIPPANPSVTAIAPAHVAAAGNTLMASAILSNGYQQVLIYDQSKSTMATYHIESSTGDIQLKSVRKMDADFALHEFNLSEPTPSTIRKNVK